MTKCLSGSIPTSCRPPSRSSIGQETVLAAGRFDTNNAGYAAMKHVAAWLDRVWAVEGSGGGRPLAQRLLVDGEPVVDVPPNCRRGLGCSTLATTERPMLTTRTRSRPWRSAPRVCERCLTTAIWRSCGC